ncbi:MAG: phosphatidate cytidylyltransferase [Pseudomonadota bacterium]
MAEINGRRVMDGLGLRVATGLGLALAAVLVVLLAPLAALTVAVAAIAGLCMREYLRLTLPELTGAPHALGLALAAAIPLASLAGGAGLAAALGLGLVLAALACLVGAGDPAAIQRRCLALGWGLLYCAGLISCYLLLAALPQGRLLILFGVAAVVAADTGAYFAGHLTGRHRLAPSLSPGKTWEGLAGGLLLSALVGGAFASLWLNDTAALAGAGLAVALGAIAAVGDLLESVLKRAGGAKDSGTLLPGHGGMLDRVDGIIAAAPLLLLCRALWWS